MPRATGTRSRLLAFASQVAKFGAVGLVGFVVDITVFNLLRASIFSPDLVHAGPLYAKIVSTMLAIVANWIGNRYWTFGASRQSKTMREGAEFFAVSLAGMGIGLACLWVSHYLLGYTSVLADNISSNVVGLFLGSVFRFVLYRYWVFSPVRQAGRGAATALNDGSRTDGSRTGTARTDTARTDTGSLATAPQR
ncbi:GtrA family protein [Cryobacterium sp. TMT2-23]|uniref:GtrA family protein n=1 Tax=Cryobacterium sp. TMT2-23 TaxID=1259252 RepID=UPI00106B386F|nr:GtrA family protein [Cryobacterium sp. TMT2-23]TFD22854.1 GtrA family protein [Cryobacterium sp. TMT2-23]